MVQRRGQQVLDGVENLRSTLVFQPGANNHRGQLPGFDAHGETLLNLLGGQFADVEVFLHEFLVALGDVLDHGLAQGLGLVGQVGRDVGLGHAAGTVEHERLARQHIHQTFEVILLADGHVQQHRASAQYGGNAAKGGIEVGAVAVHFGDGDHARQAFGHDFLVDLAGQRLDAVNGVDDQHGGVGGAEDVAQVADEVVIAGNVDEVVRVILPVEAVEAGLNGAAALEFFGFGIQGRGSFLDLAQAVDGSGGKEEHLRHGGLAASAMTHDGVGPLLVQHAVLPQVRRETETPLRLSQGHFAMDYTAFPPIGRGGRACQVANKLRRERKQPE